MPVQSAAARPKDAARFKIWAVLTLVGVGAALWVRLRFSEPATTMARYMQGVHLAQVGRYTEAVAVWEQVRQDSPEFAYPYFQLATYHARTGRPEEAIALLKALVHLDPHFPEAQVLLAETCDQIRDRPCALNAAREAVRQEPNSIRTHLALSAAYGHFFDYGGCEKEALAAQRLAPNDAALALRCAGIYQEAGNISMTERQARRCLQLDSRNAKADYLLGWALTHQAANSRQNQEAIWALKSSISLDPHNPKPLIELGGLLVKQRRDREAIDMLENGRKLAAFPEGDGQFSRIHMEARSHVARLLGVVYARIGKPEQAQQMLKECRKLADKADLLKGQNGN